jgi:hypothetical protein
VVGRFGWELHSGTVTQSTRSRHSGGTHVRSDNDMLPA